MTQENSQTTTLGEQLVRQNGAAGIDNEMGRLRQIIQAEQRRADRLARWTKRLWLFIVILVGAPMLLLGIGVVIGLIVGSSHDSVPATSTSHVSTGQVIATTLFAAMYLILACTPVLVLIAIVMTVMTYFARRTAGMMEIRSSLVSIDAQLRLLGAAPPTPGVGTAKATEPHV